MAQWSLAEKSGRRFQTLSGGQKQRLFIALALVNDPEIVFLDEMTTGLDRAARQVAWSLVGELREQGTTVVLVTHFMDEAERLCDHVAILEQGRLIALDTPQHIAAGSGGVRAVFTYGDTADLRFLADVPGVTQVRRQRERVEVVGDGSHVVRVAAALALHGSAPADFGVVRPRLEDAYLQLTGHRSEE